MNTKAIENILSTTSPFHLLPPEIISQIAPSLTTRSYNPKEIIFSEGEEAEFGYLVVSGRVAMVKGSPNGKNLIFELIQPGSLLGIVALLGTHKYPLTARAQVKTRLIALGRNRLLPEMKQYPDLQNSFINIVTTRMKGAQSLARALAHDRIESRVASILLQLASISESNGGIELGRQELADLAGITLESASRIVKAFEKQGIIDVSHAKVVIIRDRHALLKYSNAE